MKLKTFKDLEIYHQDRVLLKQEAIKWIKEFMEKRTKIKNRDFLIGMSSTHGWIMNFFNIKEEDLK